MTQISIRTLPALIQFSTVMDENKNKLELLARRKEIIERRLRQRGLGDRVERIVQPLARAIDRVAGTNIQGCGACQKRKEYLNEKFPST